MRSKQTSALLAVVLLCFGMAACGQQGGGSSASQGHRTGGHQTDARLAGSGEYSGGYPHLPGPPISIALTRRLLDYPKLRMALVREHALMFAYYYGQPASPAEIRAAALVVKRYYAAAATGDGRRACSMIMPTLAKGLPVEYGKWGEAYLRGAKTCHAVVSRMFQRAHAMLTMPIAVRGLLVHGAQGYAFVNSTKMPVSVVALVHGRDGWTVDSALAVPMSMDGVNPPASALLSAALRRT